MAYIQHFSHQSSEYLQYRPMYPDELYEYLASNTQNRDIAWDCATGNGQAAVKLADYFNKVIATDISQEQLDIAIRKENIYYECCLAEKTSIPSSTIDLITIAQALHWFNFEEFYLEVNRIAKQDAMIAAWSYSLGKINSTIDSVIEDLYENILGDAYWPKERRFIDDFYSNIPFPFKRIKTPKFKLQKIMNLEMVVGYLNTWSAVKEYQKQNSLNPVHLIKEELEKVWGDPKKEYVMEWPLHLLFGKVHDV